MPPVRKGDAAKIAAGAPEAAAVEQGLPDAAERREAGAQDGQRVPRHTAARMRTDAAILGQPGYVVAGAFALADVAEDDELTVAEAERHIARFLKREVQTDTPEA